MVLRVTEKNAARWRTRARGDANKVTTNSLDTARMDPPAFQANQQVMTEDPRFVRQALATYATQIAGLLISLVTTAIVSRVLGPDGRGQYAVAMAIGLTGVQACNLGLHASNTYLVAKRPHLLPSLLTNSIVVSFGLGSILIGGALLVFWVWPRVAPIHGLLLLLSLIWVPLGLLFLLVENLLMGIQQVGDFNLVELVKRIAGFLLITAAVVAGATTPSSFFLAMMAGMAVALLLGFGKIRPFAGSLPQPSLALVREGIVVGFRAYLAAFFAFLVIRADLLMVKYMLGSEQAGYYSVAGSLADYLLLLPTTIAVVLFPKLLSANEGDDSRHWVKKVTLGGAALLLPLVLITALSARTIIHILFGDAFQPSAWALILLMPGVFFLGVQSIMVQYLNSRGFPLSVVWAWFVTSGLNIGVNLWAIPRYGIAGASVVSSLCYFLMFVLVWLILQNGKTVSHKIPELDRV
jgi:O-antigen/teichoic acid export membrane protein